MLNMQTSSTEEVVDFLLSKLNFFWNGLKWWQKLALGGIYNEIKEILEALRRRGKI
jgi:hypothetical protein